MPYTRNRLVSIVTSKRIGEFRQGEFSKRMIENSVRQIWTRLRNHQHQHRHVSHVPAREEQMGFSPTPIRPDEDGFRNQLSLSLPSEKSRSDREGTLQAFGLLVYDSSFQRRSVNILFFFHDR